MKKDAALAKQENRKTPGTLKEKSAGKKQSASKVNPADASPSAGIKERIVDTGEHLQERLHEVADTAVAEAGKRAHTCLQQVSDRVREIEQTGHEAARKLSPQQPKILTETMDYLADQIGELADYFEQRDARDILDDTRKLVRDHPVPALGAFALLGITAGRFLLAGRHNPDV